MGRPCQHPADRAESSSLLRTCPDCGAECSGVGVSGDDDLCYDERCPLHAMEGRRITTLPAIRVTTAERDEIKRRAVTARLTVSEYVRTRALARKRSPATPRPPR